MILNAPKYARFHYGAKNIQMNGHNFVIAKFYELVMATNICQWTGMSDNASNTPDAMGNCQPIIAPIWMRAVPACCIMVNIIDMI